MGIPLAIEASRALGFDDYVILHKTPKIHLGETWSEPVNSITTEKPQRLRMDPGAGPRRAGPPGGGGRRRHLDRRLDTGGAATGPAHRSRAGGHRHPHDRGRRVGARPWGRTPTRSAPSGRCRCSGLRRTAAADWSRTGTRGPGGRVFLRTIHRDDRSEQALGLEQDLLLVGLLADAARSQDQVDQATDAQAEEDAEVAAVVGQSCVWSVTSFSQCGSGSSTSG
jgi:hypothetical protein